MKPLIATQDEVKAILKGHLSEIRRPLKWQPLDILPMIDKDKHGWVALVERDPNHGKNFMCRFGGIGDRLYVKETFFYEWPSEDPPDDMQDCRIVYRASEPDYIHGDMREYLEYRWSPSPRMPKWASRIYLEIKDINVQKLQTINNIEITRGGIPFYADMHHPPSGSHADVLCYPPHQEKFIKAWNKANRKKENKWIENPYVWVFEVERIYDKEHTE